jgi:hypothetical protein
MALIGDRAPIRTFLATIPEASAEGGWDRRTTEVMIAEGQLSVIVIGKVRYVPRVELDALRERVTAPTRRAAKSTQQPAAAAAE